MSVGRIRWMEWRRFGLVAILAGLLFNVVGCERTDPGELVGFEFAVVGEAPSPEALEETVGALRRRLDRKVFKGARVAAVGERTVRVEVHREALPAADLERAVRGMCEQRGVLEFCILVEPRPESTALFERLRRQLEESGPAAQRGDQEGWFKIEDPVKFFSLRSAAELEDFDTDASIYVVGRHAGDYYVLAEMDVSQGLLFDAEHPWRVKRADVDRDQDGRPCLIFELDAVGGMRLQELTRRNRDRALCFLVDGVAISAPVVRGPIYGHGQIAGGFSLDYVMRLARMLSSQPLPLQLEFVGPVEGEAP